MALKDQKRLIGKGRSVTHEREDVFDEILGERMVCVQITGEVVVRVGKCWSELQIRDGRCFSQDSKVYSRSNTREERGKNVPSREGRFF